MTKRIGEESAECVLDSGLQFLLLDPLDEALDSVPERAIAIALPLCVTATGDWDWDWGRVSGGG